MISRTYFIVYRNKVIIKNNKKVKVKIKEQQDSIIIHNNAYIKDYIIFITRKCAIEAKTLSTYYYYYY